MGEVVSIKEQVEARVKEQEKGTGKGSGDEIDSDFILRCYHRNELGDGELYARIHRDRFRFNIAMNTWMIWVGNHWKVDMSGTAALAGVEGVVRAYERLAREYAGKVREREEKGKLAGEYSALVRGLYKRASALRTSRRRANCLLLAHTCEQPLSIEGGEVDQQPWLVPCKNGVINLKTGEIENGRLEDYMIKSCPVKWEGIDAPCDEWEKALLEIFSGNINLVRFWQRICGYALVGEVVHSIFVVLTGRGRNGKSLIMDTIARVLGKNAFAGPVRAEMLLDQTRNVNSSGPSPDIMSLRGLRVAYASETDDGCKISAARVKLLTGMDSLRARHPNDKYEVDFEPTHTLFLLTNHKPHAPADDFAYWERMVVFPFELSFVDREPKSDFERRADPYLSKKLGKEYPGILAWMVRGCLEWQQEGLQPPTAVREAVKEYQRDEDSIGDFIDERCVVGPDYRVTAAAVYSDFEEWWKVNVSNRVPKKKRFGKWFGKRFDRVKSGTIWYHGVGLVAAQEAVGDMFKG